MINLTKAILHILDGNAGVTVFSAAQLDLADDAAYGYVSKHLEKAAGDPGLHSGEFIGVENEFKIKLSQYCLLYTSSQRYSLSHKGLPAFSAVPRCV